MLFRSIICFCFPVTIKVVDSAVAVNVAGVLSSIAPDEIPYNYLYDYSYTANYGFKDAKMYSQEGLAIKTYNSDLFNNWLNTTYITGANSIAEITAVSTVGNKFTIDELNLSSKVYAMLNRIAISGGTYDDWLNAVYTHLR